MTNIDDVRDKLNSTIDEQADTIARLERELKHVQHWHKVHEDRADRLERELADSEHAKRHAKELAVVLAKKFPAVPGWEPQTDLLGLLLQIDNMCVGFTEKAEALDALAAWSADDIYRCAEFMRGAHTTWMVCLISGSVRLSEDVTVTGTAPTLPAAIMEALKRVTK